MEVSWVSHLRLRAVGSRDGPGSVTGLVSGRRGQPRHARPTAPARTTLGWSMHSSPPSHSCFPGGGGLQPAPGARASASCLSASPPCTITPDLRLGPLQPYALPPQLYLGFRTAPPRPEHTAGGRPGGTGGEGGSEERSESRAPVRGSGSPPSPGWGPSPPHSDCSWEGL